MANITKIADGKYRVRVSKGSGTKRRWVNKTIRGRRKDAVDYAREQETMLDTGKLPDVKLSFNELLDLWLRSIAPTVSPRTLDGYDGYLKRYAVALLGELRVCDIETIHIQAVLAEIEKSPTTVRNLHAALRACFSWAIKRRVIAENPCTGADLPAKAKREIVTFDLDEAARFTAVCREKPNGIIFEFALETGMRPEEYLALRWSDVSGGEVTVRQAVQYNRKGGGFYFKALKTSRSRRRIPISDALRARLGDHRRHQLEHRLKTPITWPPYDLIFANEVGRPFNLANLTKRYLKPIVDECGFAKQFTLYSLRHSCATLLLMLGENPKTVADRLGHSSVVMTLDTYSHVLPHIQTSATAALDRAMRG